MIEINLIPDVKQELIKAQRVRSTVVSTAITIGVIAVAAVAILAVYVFTVQTVRGSLADNDIKTESNKLIAVEDLSKTLTIQNQLTKISALNGDKKIDSRVFDMLLAILPPAPNEIQISGLTVDASGKSVKIEGQAMNSYAAVEVFKKTIDGADVKYTDSKNAKQEIKLATDISTSNTSYGEDSAGKKVLRFTLTFKYAKELFSPSSKDVTVSITNGGNATDSYLGVPKSIFADKATDAGGDK